MRAFSLAVVAVFGLALAAPRTASASNEFPPEIGLGAGQLLIGTATATAVLAIPLFSEGTPIELIAYAVLLPGPAAIGGMVCTLGQTSKHYRGDCLPVIGGAYLGALASIPLALLGGAADSRSFDNGDQGRNYTSGSAIGFIIGYAVGSALGATIAWHKYKEEKSAWSWFAAPPPPNGAAERWSELRWRPVPGARAATAATVPLLSFTF
jgi:hypothetical protein